MRTCAFSSFLVVWLFFSPELNYFHDAIIQFSFSYNVLCSLEVLEVT